MSEAQPESVEVTPARQRSGRRPPAVRKWRSLRPRSANRKQPGTKQARMVVELDFGPDCAPAGAFIGRSSRAWAPAPSGLPVSTVRATEVTAPVGSSVESLEKVQVAAKGRPRQPSSKVSVKPLTDARVSVIVACCLLGMVMDGGLKDIEKLGAGVIFTVVADEVEVA